MERTKTKAKLIAIIALCALVFYLSNILAPLHISGWRVEVARIAFEVMTALRAYTWLKGETALARPPSRLSTTSGDASVAKERDPYDDADVIRGMIEKENAQINYRVTWLITFEGFLFTGLGLALNNTVAKSVFSDQVILAFATAGISVAIISMWGLCDATAAQFELRVWQKNYHPDYAGPPVIGLDPSFIPRDGTHPKPLSPGDRIGWFFTIWNLMGVVLTFSWLMLLFYMHKISTVSVFCGTGDGLIVLMSVALAMSVYWPALFANAFGVTTKSP